MPQFDPRFIVQVDIENDAKRFVEIVVVLKSLRGWKQDRIVTVFAQKALYAPAHAGMVIDHKYNFSIWRGGTLPLSRRHGVRKHCTKFRKDQPFRAAFDQLGLYGIPTRLLYTGGTMFPIGPWDNRIGGVIPDNSRFRDRFPLASAWSREL